MVLAIYDLTDKFPKTERYGMASQLRRAAFAIPTNLTEGNARGSVREDMQYCRIARGSLAGGALLLSDHPLGFGIRDPGAGGLVDHPAQVPRERHVVGL